MLPRPAGTCTDVVQSYAEYNHERITHALLHTAESSSMMNIIGAMSCYRAVPGKVTQRD